MTDTIPTPEQAHDLAMKIIGLSGLKLCPHVKAETGRVVWCGCRPGECQQAEADNAR